MAHLTVLLVLLLWATATGAAVPMPGVARAITSVRSRTPSSTAVAGLATSSMTTSTTPSSSFRSAGVQDGISRALGPNTTARPKKASVASTGLATRSMTTSTTPSSTFRSTGVQDGISRALGPTTTATKASVASTGPVATATSTSSIAVTIARRATRAARESSTDALTTRSVTPSVKASSSNEEGKKEDGLRISTTSRHIRGSSSNKSRNITTGVPSSATDTVRHPSKSAASGATGGCTWTEEIGRLDIDCGGQALSSNESVLGAAGSKTWSATLNADYSIPSGGATKRFVAELSSFPSLSVVSISFRHSDLGQEQARELLVGLGKIPRLQVLAVDLSSSLFSPESDVQSSSSLPVLSPVGLGALSGCPKLFSLSLILSGNGLSPVGARHAALGLARLTSLRRLTLDVGLNSIQDVGAWEFGESLGRLPHLSSLAFKLRRSSLTAAGLLELAVGIGRLKRLKYLKLAVSYNGFGDTAASNLAIDALSSLLQELANASLQEVELDFSGTGFGLSQAQRLAVALAQLRRSNISAKVFGVDFSQEHRGHIPIDATMWLGTTSPAPSQPPLSKAASTVPTSSSKEGMTSMAPSLGSISLRPTTTTARPASTTHVLAKPAVATHEPSPLITSPTARPASTTHVQAKPAVATHEPSPLITSPPARHGKNTNLASSTVTTTVLVTAPPKRSKPPPVIEGGISTNISIISNLSNSSNASANQSIVDLVRGMKSYDSALAIVGMLIALAGCLVACGSGACNSRSRRSTSRRGAGMERLRDDEPLRGERLRDEPLTEQPLHDQPLRDQRPARPNRALATAPRREQRSNVAEAPRREQRSNAAEANFANFADFSDNLPVVSSWTGANSSASANRSEHCDLAASDSLEAMLEAQVASLDGDESSEKLFSD